MLTGRANCMFLFTLLLLILLALACWKKSQHWEHQRPGKTSVQPGGTDTVSMELTARLSLPHFPEEWQLIMDDPLLKLHRTWRCRQIEPAWWFLIIRTLEELKGARARLLDHGGEMLKIMQCWRLFYYESWLLGLWNGTPVLHRLAICVFPASLLTPFFFSSSIFYSFQHHSRDFPHFQSHHFLFHFQALIVILQLKSMNKVWDLSPASAQCCGQCEILHSPHTHSRSGEKIKQSRKTPGC